MDLLGELTEQGVGVKTHEPPDEIRERSAARAVLFRSDGKIALLFVAKKGIYKIPGGGLEEGESVEEGLRREVLEETGCELIIRGEVGVIVEHRHKWGLRQASSCFLAQTKGEAREPAFTEKEISQGFQLVWMSLQDAIAAVRDEQALTYSTRFIKSRELLFLERAQQLIS